MRSDRGNQTKDTGKKKGEDREVASQTWRGNRRYKMKERLTPHGRMYININGLDLSCKS